MTPRKIFALGAILAALLVFGSLGFVLLEGWSFFDSMYMTVTTLTTVGYGEVHPLSRVGKLYNMVLILAGIGVLFYIITALGQVVVEGKIQEALGKHKFMKNIKKLSDHYIICGFGRIGEIIARYLKKHQIPLVIIDSKPDSLARLEESDYYYVAGDATREEVLLEAGIKRAKGLVGVVGSDANNVYITLTARSLNPHLFIVARGEEPGTEKKLRQAGADRVVSPHEIGGRSMAHTILHPTVVDFLDLALKEGVELNMEQIAVMAASPMVGLPLKESGIRPRFDLIIVAIKRADGEMLFNPQPETPILAGDTLIALGNRKNLDALEEVARQDSSSA